MRDHVAPEIRRRRIAVQEHDRCADADLHVGHEAVEDRHAPPFVEAGRRDGVRHRRAIISVPRGTLAGLPNAMARWRIGTSGYVYRDWRRRFYPEALGARGWLPYYAATFDTVELNSPFYRLPRAATFRAWAAAVPSHFVFAVKASRFLTHIKRLNEPGPPVTLFLKNARGLDNALGPVLIQLPATFHLRLDRLDGLLRVLARRPHVRWVLEVRHASWLVEPVFERLARANVSLCLHDWKEQPVTGPLT